MDNFQYLEKASLIPEKTGYCVMKNDILPMFEDKAHGDNTIRIQITTKDSKDIDYLWEYLVMGVLQGVFDDQCYTGIETKKNDRGQFCAVWVVGDEETLKKAQANIRKYLHLPENLELNKPFHKKH